MESELASLREENTRLMAKVTELEFEKAELEARNAELIERVAKLEEKQLENVVIKILLHASQVSRKNAIMSPGYMLIKQYSGMDIFSSNHYFAYGIGDIYANHEVIFIDLQGINK